MRIFYWSNRSNRLNCFIGQIGLLVKLNYGSNWTFDQICLLVKFYHISRQVRVTLSVVNILIRNVALSSIMNVIWHDTSVDWFVKFTFLFWSHTVGDLWHVLILTNIFMYSPPACFVVRNWLIGNGRRRSWDYLIYKCCWWWKQKK